MSEIEISADQELHFVQIGLRGGALPEWNFAKIPALGVFLRTLPADIKEAVGYGVTKSSITSNDPNYYFDLMIGIPGQIIHNKYSSVDDLLTYLDSMPKIARSLDYDRAARNKSK